MAEDGKLLIAIDFDQTWTADPELWRDFSLTAISRGHQVVCVTARRNTFEHRRHLEDRLPEEIKAYFAYDQPKRDYMKLSHDLWPDIWIDDMPEGI